MVQKKLKELELGKKGKVLKIIASGTLKRRILDMGITKGAEIEVERLAPLGDPLEIKVKGYHLSLRKDEAENIYVEVEE